MLSYYFVFLPLWGTGLIKAKSYGRDELFIHKSMELSWNEASLFCAQNGGTLPVIDSPSAYLRFERDLRIWVLSNTHNNDE